MWAWVKGLFAAKKAGVLFAVFAQKALAPAVAQIADPENQMKAYEFVRELSLRKDMTNREKAEAFNLKMLDWAGRVGRVLAESAVNCLRELAVNALKA